MCFISCKLFSFVKKKQKKVPNWSCTHSRPILMQGEQPGQKKLWLLVCKEYFYTAKTRTIMLILCHFPCLWFLCKPKLRMTKMLPLSVSTHPSPTSLERLANQTRERVLENFFSLPLTNEPKLRNIVLSCLEWIKKLKWLLEKGTSRWKY